MDGWCVDGRCVDTRAWMGCVWTVNKGTGVVCERLIRGRVMCMDEAVVVLVRVDAISRV